MLFIKDNSNIQLSELGDLAMLIMTGLELAKSTRNIVNTCVNFFCKLGQPLTKSGTILLGELMAVTKLIQVMLGIILQSTHYD